jgi:predicted metal-dependent peptidase
MSLAIPQTLTIEEMKAQDEEALDKVLRIKSSLSISTPFLATMLSYTTIEARRDMEIKTMAVMQKAGSIGLLFYPEFVLKLSDDELKFVLTHEIYHLILESFDRSEGKDHQCWNTATDCVINELISSESGHYGQNQDYGVMPDGIVTKGLINYKGDLISELIYEHLSKNAEKICTCGGGQGNGKGKRQSSNSVCPKCKGKKIREIDSHDYLADLDSKAQSDIKQIVELAKSQGSMPGNLVETLDQIAKKNRNWTKYLKKMLKGSIGKVYKGRYTDWNRHSRRLPTMIDQTFVPNLSFKPNRGGKVIVAIDTSGSIGTEELGLFFNEIENILQLAEVTLIQCDAQIQGDPIKYIKKNQWKNIEIKGRGGTAFEPVFDLVSKDYANCKYLVYLTDGYASWPPEPNYKVIWAITNNDITPPYGQTVRICS